MKYRPSAARASLPSGQYIPSISWPVLPQPTMNGNIDGPGDPIICLALEIDALSEELSTATILNVEFRNVAGFPFRTIDSVSGEAFLSPVKSGWTLFLV